MHIPQFDVNFIDEDPKTDAVFKLQIGGQVPAGYFIVINTGCTDAPFHIRDYIIVAICFEIIGKYWRKCHTMGLIP